MIHRQNKNDWPESQLVPPHAGDSGQHLLYFFINGKQMRTLCTAGMETKHNLQ